AFTQTADGLLEIQIGGHPASGAFGKLVVTGLASFNGTFEVSLANGYGPNLGTTYQVATFGGRAGTFAHEIGIAPLFTRTIGTGAIVLNAVATAADLAVTEIEVPTGGAPGVSVTVTYSISNLSGATATGPW